MHAGLSSWRGGANISPQVALHSTCMPAFASARVQPGTLASLQTLMPSLTISQGSRTSRG